MVLHDFSYDPRDPFFDAPGLAGVRWAVQIFTLHNVYGLDRERVRLAAREDGLSLVCDGLTWGGQQFRAPGRVTIDVRRDGGATAWRVAVKDVIGEGVEPVKSVKLLWRGLPEEALEAGWWHATHDAAERHLVSDADPLVWRYPTGWGWQTPWACAGADGAGVCVSARDPQVRPKRLCVHRPPYGGGGTLVELVCEEDARHFDGSFEAPEVRLRVCDSRSEVDEDFRGHLGFLERAYNLQLWTARPDVPAWVRDVRLVLNVSGQHWTGYVFNTFDRMADALRFVARHMPGERVVAFVLGWEGRYYYSYPHFRAGEAMGGEAGFRRLREASRETGVHLMPMFGAHGANAQRYPGWERAAFRNRTDRYTEFFNKPDWDSDRSGEDDQVFLNPGEPGYRAHLLEQIARAVDAYDLEAVYLDTTAAWCNDPRHSFVDGYRALLHDLRARHPRLFVAGESWWDALLELFAFNLSWTGTWRRYRQPELLTRYGRTVRHIEEGGWGRGSTGVHERGHARLDTLLPVTPGHVQAVNIVDDTLERHADELAALCRALGS